MKSRILILSFLMVLGFNLPNSKAELYGFPKNTKVSNNLSLNECLRLADYEVSERRQDKINQCLNSVE